MPKFLQPVCPVCHRDTDPKLNRALKSHLKSKVFNPSVGMTNQEWDYFTAGMPKSDQRMQIEEVLRELHESQAPPEPEKEEE